MKTLFTKTELIRRPAHMALDNTPIHVGDVVHLQPAHGPAVRAKVIYNAPIDGTTTYTTELVPCGASTVRRFRFRHEHVHRIEPLRPQTRR